MFTGLVETRSPVRRRLPKGTGLAVWIAVPEGWSPVMGDSICVSGACLSVAALERGEMLFELSAETLARTWLGAAEPGVEVNLERAMRLSDRLDGHLVSGHVDGQGRVVAVRDTGDGGCRITVEVPEAFQRWLVEKGSVAVDGVSLTVVEPCGRLFDVAVVPITLEKTTLGGAAPGRAVNLEADPIGKWIERLLLART
ncbi:MAG: riboflavin synthase [Planctomycetota bacterium]